MSAALFAFLAIVGGLESAPQMKVSDLRCEYSPFPTVVETLAPRLSWITESAAPGWKQSAYQILVASSSTALATDQADLWDSGKVASEASIQIPYAGKALRSRQSCYWKVRVWDASGNASGWSKTQSWEMGLLEGSDWGTSAWIGGHAKGDEQLPAPFLRKEFVLSQKVARARLYASGVGYAELHVNGHKLGETVERDPGYTNFDKRVLYVAHDVTRQLKVGPNSLGAILGTGWYNVHDRATWNFEKAPWRAQPALKAILYVEYANGQSDTIVTDPSWRTAPGPIVFDGIYTGEVYDARLEMTGWSQFGFDDKSWQPAAVLTGPKGVLAGRACNPVVISKSIKPVAISEPKPGVFVVDLGQNISGHVKLRVKGAAGDKVTLRYSERLDKQGMIQRSEIETFMTKETPVQPFQTDVYILKGRGVEEWEQRFSYSGFRYVEVTGFPGKLEASNIEGRFAHTAFESAGEFSCSDEMLNKIQAATRYSYLSNAQSIPTDCPQREKNGWTGDAHLAAEAGLMNFRSESFYTKWLDDYSDDMKADGAVSVIIPTGGWGYGNTHPAWDSAFHIIAGDMLRYSGDTRLLDRHYEKLKRYVDHLYKMTEDGIVPFDSLGDWLPWSTETSSKLTSTVCLYIDAKVVANAAKMNGNTSDAAKYEAVAEAAKTGFNKHFMSPEMVAGSTQTALSLAVYFDLVPPVVKKAAFDALVANVEKQGHIDTGIIGAKFILRALSESGRTDLAYKLVSRKEQPSWAWWIGQGATTLWEDWKGESSLNHIMFGDVSNWFYQWIAGIGLDPEVAAFKHVLFHPQPVADLKWAKATHFGPYGKISSSWKKSGSKFQLEIVVPPNTTATVWVPGMSNVPAGLKLVKTENGFSVFEVGSGRYRFDSKL